MPSFYQKTINREIQFKGVGLHCGKKVNMKLVPAAPNHGIVFKRTDLKTKNLISAVFNNVSRAVLCTNIQNEFGVTVSTIEHLMGALYGEEIDKFISCSYALGVSCFNQDHINYGCGIIDISFLINSESISDK